MGLFAELERRNVIRVALLYAVAAWVVMQVVDVGVSLLGLPDWTGRLAFLLLAVGFPVAVIFAWAFEITPQGLKRESEVDRSRSITGETAKRLNKAVIALLLIAIGITAVDRFIPERAVPGTESTPANAADAAVPEHSIAVLPFVNMSADAENEYFATGLSEELLNLLAKIPDLHVAARTSSFSFRNSDADIASIAEKLHVAHVLEGSVRKSGNELRITAQLINASTGYHLWSDTWNRQLTDVFVIQDEIAEAVVKALRLTILGELPRARPTDTEAFSLYLQAKTATTMEEGEALLQQALSIDPNYADGWAALARIYTNRAGQKQIPEEIGYAQAKAAAERALAIDPEHARALSVLSWNTLYWSWDFERAYKLMKRAYEIAPKDEGVLNNYAVQYGIFSKPERAIELLQQSIYADPMDLGSRGNLVQLFLGSGDVAAARTVLDTMKELNATLGWTVLWETAVLLAEGDAALAAEKALTLPDHWRSWTAAFAYQDLGDQVKADEYLKDMLDNRADSNPYQIASLYAQRGDADKTFEWLERAYEQHDSELIELRTFEVFGRVKDDPRWQAMLEKLGLTDADAERIGIGQGSRTDTD